MTKAIKVDSSLEKMLLGKLSSRVKISAPNEWPNSFLCF